MLEYGGVTVLCSQFYFVSDFFVMSLTFSCNATIDKKKMIYLTKYWQIIFSRLYQWCKMKWWDLLPCLVSTFWPFILCVQKNTLSHKIVMLSCVPPRWRSTAVTMSYILNSRRLSWIDISYLQWKKSRNSWREIIFGTCLCAVMLYGVAQWYQISQVFSCLLFDNVFCVCVWGRVTRFWKLKYGTLS